MPGRDPLLDAMGGTSEVGYEPDLTDKLNREFFHGSNLHESGDPSSMFTPNSKYNTSDYGNMDIGKAIFNSTWRNMWNDFKQGIDQTQIITDQGRMEINGSLAPWDWTKGFDGPSAIIDNADKRIDDLNKQLQEGSITPGAYIIEKKSLDKATEEAQKQMNSYQKNVDDNTIEISNEPVSTKYKWKSAMLQAQGDQGALSDRLLYTAPNTIGSSMSLMGPSLWATFGNNVNKALIKSAVSELAGPEVGILVQAIATVGALGSSFAELAYSRILETYGEVAQSAQAIRQQMVSDYMKENNIIDPLQIDPKVMRDIRIKSREGLNTQYWENMALTIPDIIGAMAMPLGNMGLGLSKTFKLAGGVEDAMNAVRDYNKLTRVLYTGAELGTEAFKEKFEEGFQQAAQYRAQGSDASGGTYKHQSIVKDILEDGYDTFGSLNYSLIPGLDLRGDGRYSKDPNFQFSENSGGMLAILMSGLTSGTSIIKDIKAYRVANKDIQNSFDIDGKLKRLQTQVMLPYFENDNVHHLGEAIKSLIDKKDEQGNPIISQQDAVSLIKDMHDTYQVWSNVTDKLDNISGDIWGGFRSSGELKVAKQIVKMDYLDAITNRKAKNEQLAQLELEKDTQYSTEQGLTNEVDTQRELSDLVARRESVDRLIAQQNTIAAQNKVDISQNSHKETLEKLGKELDTKIKEQREVDKELGLEAPKFEVSPTSQGIYDKITANQVFSKDYNDKIERLNKIKTQSDLFAYKKSKDGAPKSQDLQDLEKEDTTPTNSEVADKIVKGEKLTPQEAEFRQNNAQTIQGEVDSRKGQEEASNEQQTPLSDDQQEFDSIINHPTYNNDQKVHDINKLLGSNISQIDDPKFPNFIAGLKGSIFEGNPNYIRDNFNTLQEIHNHVNPGPRYIMNKDGSVSIEPNITDIIPPTQALTKDSIDVNRVNDNEINKEEDSIGSGKKRFKAVIIGQKNVAFEVEDDKELSLQSKYGKEFIEGELQFTKSDKNYHQDLNNTPFVQVGDVINVSIIKELPEGFTTENVSDGTLDSIDIGQYKDSPGNISTPMLIGYLPKITSLDKLLADFDSEGNLIDKEPEKKILREQRISILKAGYGVNHKYVVKNKGFGSINLNSKRNLTTIDVACGGDTRSVVSIIMNDSALPVKGEFLYPVTFKNSNGGAVLLIANEVGLKEDNGEPSILHLPIYLTKKQLSNDVNGKGEPTGIFKKVLDGITTYLQTGAIRDTDEAKKYVYLTNKKKLQQVINLGGIYRGLEVNDKTGKMEPVVWANEYKFTKDNMSGLRDAIGRIYPSLSKEQLVNDDYQNEIKKSPLFLTNIVANPTLLERYNSGEYSFLKDNQQYSYYSQHTIEIEPQSHIDEVTGEETPKEEDINDIISNIDFGAFDEPYSTPVNPKGKLAKVLGKIKDSIDNIKHDISGAKKLLIVSPDIPPSLQYEMTRSLAANLARADKQGDITNKDRIKAWVESEHDKYVKARDTIKPEHLDNLNKLINNYKLMDEHIDGLLDKANELIASLGFRYDENTDYYENLDEQDENGFKEFEDDANRTTDPWDKAPKEIKKLMYFTPKIDSNGKVIKNVLNLDTYNDVRDTQEKVLSITTSRFYDATNTGSLSMLNDLLDKKNAPVVIDFAKRLQGSQDKVQAAFFTYARKQHIQNLTSLYTAKTSMYDKLTRSYGTKRNTSIFLSNSNQGIRAIFNRLEASFMTSKTGIFMTDTDHAGNNILRVDRDFVNQKKESIERVLANPESLVLFTDTKQRKYKVLTTNAKQQIHQLLGQLGINISYNAFEDSLQYYKLKNTPDTVRQIDVVKQLYLKYIIGTLSGQPTTFSKDTNEEVEEDVNTEALKFNPFRKERSSLMFLAKQEAKYTENPQSGAYRAPDGKPYYPYGNSCDISDIFLKIQDYKENSRDHFIINQLRADTYAKNSLLLPIILDKNKDPKLELHYELGSRNTSGNGDPKLLKDMNEREHTVTKLAWFQNKGKEFAYYMWDTLSDKFVKPVASCIRLANISRFGYAKGGIIQLSDDNLEMIYNSHFINEYNRVLQIIEQNKTLPEYSKIKGYHGDKGMGQYFLTFYSLNKDIADTNNPELSKALYNSDGTLKPLTNDNKKLIMQEISDRIGNVIARNRADLQRLGIFDLDATNKFKQRQPDLTDLIDDDYMFKGDNSVVRRLGLELVIGIKEARGGDWSKVEPGLLNHIVNYVVTDHVVNSMLFNNEMLLLTGDPAQAGKLADKDTISKIKNEYKDSPLLKKKLLLANIEATFFNLNKRNAGLMASGTMGRHDNPYYYTAIANDMAVSSNDIAYYTSMFDDAANKAYGDNDILTDAQEFTTVGELLRVDLAHSKISRGEYARLLYVNDRDQYNRDFKKGLVLKAIVHPDEVEGLKNYVMQPDKPVQRSRNIDPEMGMSINYYIKTSAIPLIPDLLTGSMSDLLNDMKDKGVDRVAFVSGVKQGVSGSKDIFDKEGNYNREFLTNNINRLDRNGFRIQQEVPFKEDKDHIREGTQQSKLLFVDIHDDTPLLYRGSLANSGDLKGKYLDYHKKIIDIQKKQIYQEIGVNIDNLTLEDKTKLSQMLQREGANRGYSLNSLLGLDIQDGNFKIPLTFLENAAQIEPVLTALLSNNITRLKMPGRSDVQTSSFLLKTGKGKVVNTDEQGLQEVAKRLSKDNRGIVWTKPEYENLEKLSYLRKDDQGNVLGAQIVVPFYFNKEGKLLDVADYTIHKDGKTFLDTTKIDPELLQMNGFRIPFQGLNSGMWFEIVGFLPKQVGNTILVPGEIAGQMGSDYDVDKLYSYLYNYKFGEDGTISKVDNATPESKEELQNALIDIQRSVYLSNNEEIHRSILKPQAFDDLQATVNYLGVGDKEEFDGAWNPMYQRDNYFSGTLSKIATAITASANTAHAMAQVANLFIKGQGVLFIDEIGNAYTDHISNLDNTNSINKIHEDTYQYIVKDKEHPNRDQNSTGNNSAWNIGKVKTFVDPVTNQTYNISNLLNQMLGVSVDNVKEQKLAALGINEDNFNVALTILRVGFPPNIMSAFIRQPILQEYYKVIGATDDIYRVDYTPNKKNRAIADLFERYTRQYNLKENIQNNNSFQGFKLSQMKDWLSDGITASNVKEQLYILKAFLRYKDISDNLQAIASALNIDSKGFPKNMSEVQDRADKINKILGDGEDSKNIGNINNLIHRTIPGLFAHMPAQISRIFMPEHNPIFAYKSNSYIKAKSDILNKTTRQELNVKDNDTVNRHLKQFIYSGFTLVNDVTKERERLLFDTPTNESMQTRLINLRRRFPRNDFLQAIREVPTIYSDDPKQVEIPISNEEDYIQKISELWNQAIYGRDLDLQQFATDLVNYAIYVSPQEYGSSNMVRYLPDQYKEEIGFNRYLRDLNSMIGNDYLFQYFADQYLQHDDRLIVNAREKDINGNWIVIQGSIKTGPGSTPANPIIQEFSLPPINDENNSAKSLIRMVDGEKVYPEYLSMHNNNIIKKQTYKKKLQDNGIVTYSRVDKKGVGSITEYDMRNANPSTIVASQRTGFVVPDDTTQVISDAMQGLHELTPVAEDVDYLNEDSTPNQILSGIIKTDNGIIVNPGSTKLSKQYATLYHWLAVQLQSPDLDQTKIILDIDHPVTATTTEEPSIITINPNYILSIDRSKLDNQELEKQRILLHELLHVKLFKALKERHNTPEYKAVEDVWNAYRDNIQGIKGKIRGVQTSVFDAELLGLLHKEYVANRSDLSGITYNNYVRSLINPPKKGTLDHKEHTKQIEEHSKVLDKFLDRLGNQFDELYKQGKIPASEFNLLLNKTRAEEFKDHIVKEFLPNLDDIINKYYPYVDLNEFVTEALTNKETQQVLKKMPGIWDRFINSLKNFLASIFGIETEERTLLDDAFDSIFGFIGNNEIKDVSLQPDGPIVTPIITNMNIQGINISTRSSDKLGRALTNPTWGSMKDGAKYFDVESAYKTSKSKNSNPQEALREDMNTMYTLIVKKLQQNPELVQQITDRGGVKFLEASEHTIGVRGSRWEGKGTNSNFIQVLIEAYKSEVGPDISHHIDIANSRPGSSVNSNMNVKNHSMSYQMPANENITGMNTSTVKLAEEGKRTATTRSYPLGKVGDIITFEGRPQQYRITGVEQLTQGKVSDHSWVKQWSDKEGWTTEHFNKVLGGKTVHIGSYQTSYEKVGPGSSENSNRILFQEEPTTGYRNRTIKNASADATIAIAVDFNSAGEKLTKTSVLNQGKQYIPLDFNDSSISKERVDKIVGMLNQVNAKTLNIAGNGIYTMKGRFTQAQVDEFTYDLLKAIIESPRLNNKIESIRSGGQTGFDEAGAKAAQRLGIKTIVLAPKGWTFRDENGQDISNEAAFKARFGESEAQGSLFKDSIDTQIDELIRLGLLKTKC